MCHFGWPGPRDSGTPMKFMLDAGPMRVFFDALGTGDVSLPRWFVTPMIVWNELPHPVQDCWQRTMELADLVNGTDAANLYYRVYRHQRTTSHSDAGEDAMLASCVCDFTDALFVSCDALALGRAVSELGASRVCSALDLWRRLRDEGVVDAAQTDLLFEKTVLRLRGTYQLPRRFSND